MVMIFNNRIGQLLTVQQIKITGFDAKNHKIIAARLSVNDWKRIIRPNSRCEGYVQEE
jgi:hypothetical protein